VLEVGGRPVLDYVVERMWAALADEIRLVTRPEKADVIERAARLDLTVVEAQPPNVSDSVLAGAAGLASDDVVLLGLPDSVWEPLEGFAELLDALTRGTDAVLGVFRSTEPRRGDVVALAADGRVSAVHVKPADPPGELIWGCAAIRAGSLEGLRRHPEPGHLFAELAERGRVRAVRFPGEFIDIGTKEALARARTRLGTG
jgi:glucose-1-phosphate thymidylyltransferase